MEEFGKYLLIIISAVLVNNFVLTRFLGICPFLGVSKKLPTALGMCGAVIFVMTSASMVTWLLSHYFLAEDTSILKLDLGYLQTIVFILVIASFVQLVEIALKKISPALHGALGIYLPLITTNCAVLGVAVLNIKQEYTFPKAAVFGFAASLGFSLALVIFTGLREKIDRSNPPRAFQGVAIALITAGLLSLAFMGFAGLGM
ncbi:MAG: electron transport complex subunit RsxA [Kiritimatiellia bacterium]